MQLRRYASSGFERELAKQKYTQGSGDARLTSASHEALLNLDGWRSASPRLACDMAAADVVAALVLPTPARATGGVLRDAHGSQQNRQQRGGGSCFLRLLS
jgi:hypothetical protein